MPENETPAELFGGKRQVGRKKGSRQKLANTFFADLGALWEEQGAGALARAAFHEPMAFVSMVAKLMPQKLEISTPTSGMSDDQLETLIAYAEARAAELAGVGGAQDLGQAGGTGGGGPAALGPSGEGIPPIHTAPSRPTPLLSQGGGGFLIDITPGTANNPAPLGGDAYATPLKPFSRGAIPASPVPVVNPRLDQARALAEERQALAEMRVQDPGGEDVDPASLY